jgi:hypothetical protein
MDLLLSPPPLPAAWDWRAPGPHARMPALGTTNVCSRVLNQRGIDTYCGACWVRFRGNAALIKAQGAAGRLS